VINWDIKLRSELRVKAAQWAAKTSLPFYESRGKPSTILFETTPDGCNHGNFFDSAWKAVRAEPDWRERLKKPHSQRKALPDKSQAYAMELDSSNSSDALLMNCFCPPAAATRIAVALGLSSPESRPQFGYKPCLPLKNGETDTTEIDMRLGDTLFEAKLTEHDFTSTHVSRLSRYAQLDECFDVALLPRGPEPDTIGGYQLIRNVLAASKDQSRLIVLIDYRRPDLLQEWWKVHGAIRSGELRNRCEVHFWQEVAAACQSAHHQFLEDKYGL
jgi:hypothetical protein